MLRMRKFQPLNLVTEQNLVMGATSGDLDRLNKVFIAQQISSCWKKFGEIRPDNCRIPFLVAYRGENFVDIITL